jgi:hypothetical protein
MLERRIAPVIGAIQRATVVTLGDPAATGVVEVVGPGGSFGTGVLLSTGRDILTAAHVVTDKTGTIKPGNFTIVFEVPQTVKITVPSSLIIKNPGWDGNTRDGNDLAILPLPMPAPAAATRYQLYTGADEVGKTFTIDGFGDTGVGDTGDEGPTAFASYGTLRTAQNRHDATNAVFGGAPVNPIPARTPLPNPAFPANSALVYDFDDGQVAHDALGFFYGLNNLGLGNAEGFPAPGDSGGPGFIGGAVASIVSYGFGFPDPPDVNPGTNNSFGEVEVEVDTRVSAFAGWINSVINVNRLQVDMASPVTAGAPIGITVTAVNAYGMAIPGYTGTVTFTTTDPNGLAITLPPDYTFVAGDNGRHSFPGGATLVTAGPQSITATDTANPAATGYGDTTVNATDTDHFEVDALNTAATAFLPRVAPGVFGPIGTGATPGLRVTAEDRYGNTTPNYLGTIQFASSDAAAVLPPNYRFTGFDQWQHVFTLTKDRNNAIKFMTAGDRTAAVRDAGDAAINGETTVRVLAPGTPVSLLVNTPTQVTAGAPFVVTVQALDVFGGIAPGYLGRVHFTTTDLNGARVLPPDYTFTVGVDRDNGSHSFNGVVLVTAGLQRIIATDTADPSITGDTPLTVLPAVTDRFLVTPAAPNVVPNLAFGATVTA